MFQWATEQFDKLSQTVAPPPTDAAGRYAYAVQRLEEDTAMGCIAEIDPIRTVVNQSKGYFPIHLACQYSMTRLVQLLLSQPGMDVGQPDYAGNTPLHHACMSTQRGMGLNVVKMLINEYGADVLTKNSQGQTPYDVATLDSIRQYLLPIQLQKETQIALDNGGQGLPPGIDLGGLRIKNPTMAPPPVFGGAGVATPPPAAQLMATPNQSRYAATPIYAAPAAGPASMSSPPPPPLVGMVAPAPSSMPGSHGTGTPATTPTAAPVGRATSVDSTCKETGYSRVGGSSLAVFSTKYRADGFHSSSSDVGLQKKYGHTGVSSTSGSAAVPPPPSSGNAPSAPSSGGGPVIKPGNNPFGGGFRPGSRYVAYGPAVPVTAPAPVSGPAYSQYAAYTAAPVPQYFVPGATGSNDTAVNQQQHATPSVQPTTPYMPPPPYQTQNYAASPAPTTPAAVAGHSTSAPDTAAAAFAATFSTPQPKSSYAGRNAASVFDSPPETNNQEGSQRAEPTSDSTAPAATSSSLSSDWAETVDPTTQRTYYYNSRTGETSWERPAAMDGVVTTATTTVNGVAASSDNDDGDWTETTDPSSGRVYYYNKTTGETSWEKPSNVTKEEEEQDSEKIVSEETKEEELTTPPADESEPGSTQEEPEMANTAEAAKEEPTSAAVNCPPTEYKPEEEQTFEKSTEPEEERTEEEQVVEEKTQESGEKPQQEAVVQENTPQESSSPVVREEVEIADDWVEVPDPSTGRCYFYNSKTQETSWEKPRKDEAVKTADGTATGNLADGWVEVMDPSSGKTYYYCQATNETSWEKPVSKDSGAVTSISSAELKKEWMEAVDPSTGKTYYYTRTGETVWEKPAELIEAEQNANESTEAALSQQEPPADTTSFVASAATNAEGESGSESAFPEREAVVRTKSAEDLFADGPPQSKESQPAIAFPASGTSSAENVLRSSPVSSRSAVSADDLVGARHAGSGSSEARGVNTMPPSEPAKGAVASADESTEMEEDGEMTDIPLSPDAIINRSKDGVVDGTLPKLPNTNLTSGSGAAAAFAAPPQPHAVPTATTASQGNDLFAAIGMPPPPFQSRR